MKELSAPANDRGSHTGGKLKGKDIDLPDAPDFVSLPPRISLAAAMRLNESLLPSVNSRPGESGRRRREKVTEPFEV